MIVEYAKKHESMGASSGGPTYGAGNEFPDSMDSVQRYPRAEGIDHRDEARAELPHISNMNPPMAPGANMHEYPRSDGKGKIDPYDPTVPSAREGDTLDKRSRNP